MLERCSLEALGIWTCCINSRRLYNLGIDHLPMADLDKMMKPWLIELNDFVSVIEEMESYLRDRQCNRSGSGQDREVVPYTPECRSWYRNAPVELSSYLIARFIFGTNEQRCTRSQMYAYCHDQPFQGHVSSIVLLFHYYQRPCEDVQCPWFVSFSPSSHARESTHINDCPNDPGSNADLLHVLGLD